MDADEVLRVLDALERAGVDAGMTGGWGVDALLGRETRRHGDVDLGISARDVDRAIEALTGLGYAVEADQRPARLELRSGSGRVDLHPIVWDETGAGVQRGFGSETWVYPPGSLSAPGTVGGRSVRCATPELQVAFHMGYPPKDVDRRDLAALAEAFGVELPRPDAG